MSNYIRPVNQDQMFQIPLIAFTIFLIAALLAWLLGFGKPSVAVAISLDLSSSTYSGTTFNAENSVMYKEIQSVRTYLQENQKLRIPNQVQVFGFGGSVQPLTNEFTDNNKQIEFELLSSLKEFSLPQKIDTSKTNINEAIKQGNIALGKVSNRCRELLIVTDGQAVIDNNIVVQAKEQKIAINAIVVGADAPELEKATNQTSGVYISGEAANLEKLFTDKFFEKFNSNTAWIALLLGLALASFMWMLVLPLDRWLLQGMLNIHMSTSGQIAIGNAIFWSVLTPVVVLSTYGFPFLSRCAS